jgi:hypothetical protein
MPNSPDFKYNRSVGDILRDARKPPTIPETGWWKIGASQDLEISFENSWDNVGGGESPARHYLSEDGDVRSDGKVIGGDPDTVIYTLPDEMKPEFKKSYVCATEDDSGNRGIAIIDVLTDGSVKYIGAIDGIIGGSGGSGGLGSIDGGSP